MNINNLIASKYEEYLSKKTDKDIAVIIRNQDEEKFFTRLSLPTLFFVLATIILGTSISTFFLYSLIQLNQNGFAFLSFIFSLTITTFVSMKGGSRILNKMIVKKISKMQKEEKYSLLKDNLYQDFLNHFIDSEIVDFLKIKYSTEDFKILMMSTNNSRPTYFQLIQFEKKRSSVEGMLYSVDENHVKQMVSA